MADLANASLEEIRRNGWSPILVLEARLAEAERRRDDWDLTHDFPTDVKQWQGRAIELRFALDLLRLGATISEHANKEAAPASDAGTAVQASRTTPETEA